MSSLNSTLILTLCVYCQQLVQDMTNLNQLMLIENQANYNYSDNGLYCAQLAISSFPDVLESRVSLAVTYA